MNPQSALRDPESPGYVELHGGTSAVRIVPALGGKITSMRLAGREWLWAGDAAVPRRVPGEAERADDGEAAYAERADGGGYDECFPTVGACTLPNAAGAFAGVALPDHGELWSAQPWADVRAREGGQSVTLAWRGRRMPYRFEREVCVTPSGEVEMRYTATNDGRAAMPFLWSAHPIFPVSSKTRLDLPAGTRVRVFSQQGIDLGGAGAEHRWPLVQRGGKKKPADLSAPESVARRYACKLFLDAPAGRAAVVEDGARLEVAFDAAAVPTLALAINRRGWTPFARGRGRSYVALAPCSGAPEALRDALDPAWAGAQWLQPGESRTWTLVWRGSRA